MGFIPNMIALPEGWEPVVIGGAVVLAVFAILGVRGEKQQDAPTTPEQRARARETLAALVAAQWREESAIRWCERPMPVHWRLTTDERIMDDRRNLRGDLLDPVWEGSADQIKGLAEQFRDLLRRRLVVCGDSGMGKTTLAVQLLVELLASRAGTEPVPVLLQVTGWDPEEDERFQDWLAVRLADEYRSVLTPREAEDLVAAGDILPVLDGLDEVPRHVLERILLALNTWMTEADQLIVTCRSGEYTDAVLSSEVLRAAAVVQPDPLPPRVAADYLASALKVDAHRWKRVLTHLRLARAGGRSPLVEIVATPFGLWLLLTVYKGKDVDALLKFRTVADLRAHLFEALPAALVSSRPATRRHMMPFRPRHRRDPVRLAAALQRLGWIMEDGTPGRDFAWWRLARHAMPPWSVGVVTAMVVILICDVATRLVMAGQGVAGDPAQLHTPNTFAMAAVALTLLVMGRRSGSRMQAQLLGGITIVVVGMVCGVLSAVAMAFLAASSDATTDFDIVNLSSFVPGIIAALAASQWPRHDPGFVALTVRGRLRDAGARFAGGFSLYVGVVASTWLTLVSGLGVGQRVGPGTALAIAMVTGTAVGLAAGLLSWAETANPETRASTPLTSLRGDRKLNLLRVLVVGVLPGLALGLVVARLTDPLWGLTLGMLTLVGNICFFGRHFAWFPYLVAVFGLGVIRRELPWRLMPFLDDCHRMGLLRAVGQVYQFRHADLHDHFTRPADVRSAAP